MSGRFFKAGEFAALCGVKKDTLLHYDHIGILRPERVDEETGYRYYSARQFYTFDLISALKKLGVPLREIREYLDRRSPAEFLTLLRAQLETLERERRRLESIGSLLQETISATARAGEVPFGTVRLEDCPEEHYIAVEAPDYEHYDERRYLLKIRPLLQQARQHGSLAFPPGDIISRESLEDGHFIEDFYYCRVAPDAGAQNIAKKPAGTYAVLYHRGSYESQYDAYRALYDWTRAQGYAILGNLYAEDVLHYLTTPDPECYVARVSVRVEMGKGGGS